jgi:hypothetical protein
MLDVPVTPPPSSGRKTGLWIAGGCLALILCSLGLVAVIIGALYFASKEPENATYDLSVPATAGLNQPVEFTITVANTSKKNIELVGVDFSTAFLDGLVIESSTPDYTDTNQFGGLGQDYITYYFRQTIAPGESLTLTFNAKAVTAGNFVGDVDVCINSDYTCLTNVGRIVISK